MARDNIFQLIAKNNNIFDDVDRIDKLFRRSKLLSVSKYINNGKRQQSAYTMEVYISEFCFSHWKNRGHYLSFTEFLKAINYDNWVGAAKGHVDDFLTFAELILNFIQLVDMQVKGNALHQTTTDFDFLYKIVKDDVSHLNNKIVLDEQNEQVLVIEDKPEVTAVAEIVEPTFALDLVRYNHRSLAGDLDAKKSILLQMGADLEPRRNDIKSINKQLADDIFYMLNTMNIRHNNCDSGNATKYKKFVAEMSETDLESWYDELYQMMLLAYLELDQQKRSQRVRTLKSSIEGAN